MAGQGMERREMLRVLALAAAASRFPGFQRWAFACDHLADGARPSTPARYTPQFFDAQEYATLERLSELIIPSDGSSGAKEAGVSEFIDFMVKTLCEAGLKVCALNSGRRIDPAKDFRNHRMPYEMKYRGFGDPRQRAQSYGYMDNEYVGEGIWEHGITYTTAPGTEWMWPRCHAVGGKTNFWGRSSARFGEIDFRAATLDAYDVDWPVTYEELSPYYRRVERMIGVASTVQNRPSNPDGEYLPPMKFCCLDHILRRGAEKVGVPYLPDRIAQLTRAHDDHPACHFCGNCTEGCDTGSFFSTPWFLLPSPREAKKADPSLRSVESHY